MMLVDHVGTALRHLQQQPILSTPAAAAHSVQPAAHLSMISMVCADLTSVLQLQGQEISTAAEGHAGQKSKQQVEVHTTI
jgi:hypothetical protein